MNRSRQEVTFFEDMMFMGILLLMFSFWVVVCIANIYFTENGVLRELKSEFPKTERILKTERNIFSKSIIVTEEKDGNKSIYELDSSIIFNYEFKKQ